MAKLYVHRNLHRNCWSVLHLGKLQGYRQRMVLKDVEFRVRLGGYQRAVRECRRNVHAFAVGHPGRKLPRARPIPVRYDWDYGAFVDSRGEEVLEAEAAYLRNNGIVWAYRPKYRDSI